MATGGGTLRYRATDLPDDRLLNRLSKWVMYNRLPRIAIRLGFTMAEISRIMTPSRTPEEQIFQVIDPQYHMYRRC